MRVILIIGDGMADRPLRELNYKTPLEAAKTANMDRLAFKGISGLLDPIAPGMVPGSDAAHLSILGYNPREACNGRGPFEAAGAGIKLNTEDIAFRCNFATIDDNYVVVNERAGRIRDGAVELAKMLHEIQLVETTGIEVIFKQTLGFKGTLILRGDGISSNVSAAMPKVGDRAWSIRPLDESMEAERTANVLNEFVKNSHSLLEGHPINRLRMSEGRPPANLVIPWGGGKSPILPTFYEKYKLKAALIAAVSLIKGVAKLCHISVIDVPKATGYIDTDTIAKAKAALAAIENHDLVIVNVKGPDEASHDGNTQGKISIIEKIDSMIGVMLDQVDLNEIGIVLLADHTTSTRYRKHTGDPVPISIASTEVVKDGVQKYNEKEAGRGGLGRIQGQHVMPLILNLMCRSEKFDGE
jgi:2,3-bisphosphoglycerate-independent phosphoglycerate mutase